MTTPEFSNFAQAVFDIYGQGKTLASVSESEREAFIALMGVQLNHQDLLRYEQSILQQDHLRNRVRKVMQQWQKHSLELGDDNHRYTHTFMQQWLESLNLASLYNHNLVIGISHHVRANNAFSDLRFSNDVPCWTLHFTLKGHAQFTDGDTDFEAGYGDLVMFKPGSKFRYRLHPSASEWKHVWILFQPRSHWNDWLCWNNLNPDILKLSLSDQRQVETMQNLMQELFQLKERKSPLINDFLYNQLERVLIQAKEFQGQSGLCDPRIQKACDYIQENLSKKFSVEDVAQACNLSASWLAHLFKDQMGVSLKHWHNDIRLQKAQSYLLSSRQPISKIAKQVGYEDPAVFTKGFKKHTNYSPTEFRQKHQPQMAAVG